PLRWIRYQWAYFRVNTLGVGRNIYFKGSVHSGTSPEARIRLATMLGITYLFGLAAFLGLLTRTGRPHWIAPAGLFSIGLPTVVLKSLPDWALYQSRLRQAYSAQVASAIRLGFYTGVLSILAYIRWATGGSSFMYPILLWYVPLGTSFMYFMYLRDVYQHSNA